MRKILWAAMAVSSLLLTVSARAKDGPNPTPEIQAKIDRQGYTPEELRNIKLTINFVNTPRDGREAFMAKGFKLSRTGMATAQRLSGMPKGYTSESEKDRVDTIEDIIAKGNEVWVIWNMVGTHTGPWFGIPATGKPVSFHEEAHFTFADDGKITRAHFAAEELDMVSQLGVPIQFPAAAKAQP